ncbi:NitT/TauT family transport system substrate-binding protein [Tamaricihabitans halophyticus]|uniref:NitT/TauT family transport system substrate-binding protein n=1 Tax=Tamaricihabitans halophyticus TaxID=1262583 RepID=A0A4R2Q8C1_9PSEU|nr:ABC transporter substrate-binding protein [Tamaricihabitans halophyticus]TCP45057.1 NitT/TauT family transport system substrate-binding protein [Tamaricihabitans halophyticus]
MTISTARRRLVGIGTAALTMFTVAACGTGGDSAAGGQIFAVPDKSLTATTASYTSVPLRAGYFDDEELDVTIQPVDTALSAVQSVATGQSFMTYASVNAVVSAAGQDDGLAVVGFTNGNIFRIVVPEGSPIKTVEDLRGRTVGSSTLASISNLYAKGVLTEAGLDPESDVEYLPVGYGAQAAEAMRGKEIDAYAGYDGPNVVIGDLLGSELRELETPLNELTGTSALVVRKESIENEPDRVVGMARAFFKSMVFAKENPETAIQMHWAEFPQSKPAAADEDAARKQAVEILTRRLDVTGGPGADGEYGVQDDDAMQHTVDELARYGMVDESIELRNSGLVDYGLAERYNDFDPEAVKREAANWRG